MSSASPKYHVHTPDHPTQKMPYDNMMRLLSKPAVVSGSKSPPRDYYGGLSTRSASGGSAGPSIIPKQRRASESEYTHGEGSRPNGKPRAAGANPSNWTAPWDWAAGESSTEALPLSQHGKVKRTTSLAARALSDSEASAWKGKEKEKKPRVLRRKGSTNLNRPISPSSPPQFSLSVLASGPASPTLPYSPAFLSPSTTVGTPGRPSPTLQLPKPGSSNLHTYSPTNSQASSSRNSSRSRTSPRDKAEKFRVPVAITPAAEIMLAYQRQMEREKAIEQGFEKAERKAVEARRLSDERQAAAQSLMDKEFERSRGQIRTTQSSSRVATSPPPESSKTKKPPDDTPLFTPYYTVLGTGSDVGDEDSNRSQGLPGSTQSLVHGEFGELSNEARLSARRTASVSVGLPKPPKESRGLARTLSRKLSLKWNGLRGSKHDTSGTGSIGQNEDIRARSPPAEKPGTPASDFSGLRLSIDKPYATTSRIYPRKGSLPIPETTPETPRAIHSAPTSAGPPSASTSSPVSPRPPESKSKFRSIMRRISTGGLRDRYQQPSPQDPSKSTVAEQGSGPPPVPALPQGVVSTPRTGDTIHPFPDAPRHRSRTNSDHSRRRPSPGGPPVLPPMVPSKVNLSSRPGSRRPSTATRSSSPDPYFGLNQSARSSESSLGSEFPAFPGAMAVSSVSRNILSPSELKAMHREIDMEAGMPERSLPLPLSQRRHQVNSNDDNHTRSESPFIPEFTTSGAVNTFGRRPRIGERPSTDTETMSTTRPSIIAATTSPTPPSRPSRSPRRPSAADSPSPSPVHGQHAPIYARYVKNDAGK
ncbi:hypothetical protein PQX77_017103 [Marasmius sp. AFHP31]|nr:hypothetical protein PQX77_017103 [Marasmius sp. AFHP31]